MSRRRKGGEERLLDQQQILKEYGLTKAMIRKYFPKPRVKTVHGRHGASWTVGVWPEATVQKMLEHPEIAKLRAERQRRDEQQRQMREIAALFEAYSPEAYVERARELRSGASSCTSALRTAARPTTPLRISRNGRRAPISARCVCWHLRCTTK